MQIPLGIWATAGASSGNGGAYELISTQVLSSSVASVTFSSIVSTYKHLQIRYACRTDRAGAFDYNIYRLNGDTGSNYGTHQLYGDPYSATIYATGAGAATSMNFGVGAGGTYTNEFSSGIIDISDYASTTKNKTVRSFSGNLTSQTSYQRIHLCSGLWVSTSAMTSFQVLSYYGSNFVAGSRFSLYGIKG